MIQVRTIYRKIDQKLITPRMYGLVASESTQSMGAWHGAVLSALSDLGVFMEEYPVSHDDEATLNAFLQSPDKVSDVGGAFPANTYGYGYGTSASKSGPAPEDETKLREEYANSTKFYLYHFVYEGEAFYAVLGFTLSGAVSLTLMPAKASPSSFTMASDMKPSNSDIAGLVVKAALRAYKAGGKIPSFTEISKTLEFVDAYKKSVKSSLTRYDIQSLLSDASPSKVWYSLESRIAVYQCRFGTRIVGFSHSPSGWTVSSLRQCWLVKSDSKLLVSRKASFYEESMSATSPHKTAVMFRSNGQNRFLPLE